MIQILRIVTLHLVGVPHSHTGNGTTERDQHLGPRAVRNISAMLETSLTLITKLILGKKIKFTIWEMFLFQKLMIMKNV